MFEPKCLASQSTSAEIAKGVKEFRTSLAARFTALEKGEALSVDEQKRLLAEAYHLSSGVASLDFHSRWSRLAPLQNHVHTFFSVTPFSNPEVFSRLENVYRSGNSLTGWVVSVDIRNSTELMRSAKDPKEHAEFLSAIAGDIQSAITYPSGFFDKFTGDGGLGFIPDDLAGQTPSLWALNAAEVCHKWFERRYEFNLRNYDRELVTGLGIGIDYGEIALEAVTGALTLIGEPVVWACRLSNEKAKGTLLNSQAYLKLTQSFPTLADSFEKVPVNINGAAYAYKWTQPLDESPLKFPEWYVEAFPECLKKD